MNKQLQILGVLWCLVFSSSVSFAELMVDDPQQFIAYNPDGKKYDFIKYYLKALDYLYVNEQMRSQLPALNPDNILSGKYLLQVKDHLVKENVNLRIARNMVSKYASSDNRLMLKVVDLFALICDAQIEVNNQERDMLEAFSAEHQAKAPTVEEIQKFFNEQEKLVWQRKENARSLIETSILIGKVVVSNKQNSNGQFSYLGVNTGERKKLLQLLDKFEGPQFRGQLRDGQSSFEGSISVIRSVLEDKAYTTL